MFLYHCMYNMYNPLQDAIGVAIKSSRLGIFVDACILCSVCLLGPGFGCKCCTRSL